MTARSVYLDSSAILKRYLNEEGSDVVKKAFRDAYRGSWPSASGTLVR